MGKEPLTSTQIKHIIFLREHGHSLPEIRRLTGHGKATIFKYIQGVKILPRFQEFWKNRQRTSVARMLREQKKAQDEVKKTIKNIERKEKVLIAACLYWAEGNKKDLSLSNTDPDLIRTFVRCLEEFGVAKESLRVSIRTYEDLDRKKVCAFWSKIIGIPKKSIINVNVLRGKKRGKLKYGMCRVRVKKGGYLLKLLHATEEEIKHYI